MVTRLAALFLVLCATAAPAAGPLFEYDGEAYAPDDLSPRMQQLYGSVVADHYRAMRTLVDEMVFDVYVTAEAKRQGREARDVGAELLAVDEPDDDAIRAFYELNRRSIPQPLEQVSERIRQHLKREAVLRKRDEVLARIKAEKGFRLLLEQPPAPPVAIDTRGRPVRGNPSAPITLVEFADYQCPSCKRAVKVMQLLLEQYPDQVKLVHMDFPINASGISRRVAYGGACAHAQGRFWEYHDLAFHEQESLDRDAPARLARAVGLDMTAFDACMTDPSTHATIAASEDEARRLGITATPTLFVDGRPFPSSDLLRDIGAYIAKKIGDTS